MLFRSLFASCANLTSVLIPDGLTNIGNGMFYGCSNLASVVMPGNVTRIDPWAFGFTSLTNVVIPGNVTSIGYAAFYGCTGLTSITISKSVTAIEGNAFGGCSSLSAVYFEGNAPDGDSVFPFDARKGLVIYYLPGTTGWGPTFSQVLTRLWNPQLHTADPRFGIRTNTFGLSINGSSNLVIVVE